MHMRRNAVAIATAATLSISLVAPAQAAETPVAAPAAETPVAAPAAEQSASTSAGSIESENGSALQGSSVGDAVSSFDNFFKGDSTKEGFEGYSPALKSFIIIVGGVVTATALSVGLGMLRTLVFNVFGV